MARVAAHESRSNGALPAWLYIVLLLLSLPALYLTLSALLYLVIWAFAGTPTVGVLGGATLRWFSVLWARDGLVAAVVLSTVIAAISSTLGVFLVVLVGYYAQCLGGHYDRVLTSVLLLPLVFPTSVYALSLQYVTGTLELPRLTVLILANLALLLPIQYLVVAAGNGRIASSTLWAAATCGADPWRAMIRVYVPLMADAFAAAWALGALAAFDEIMVTIFLWNAPTAPVAKVLWDLYGRSSEPIPATVAVILLAVAGGGAAVVFASFRILARRRP